MAWPPSGEPAGLTQPRELLTKQVNPRHDLPVAAGQLQGALWTAQQLLKDISTRQISRLPVSRPKAVAGRAACRGAALQHAET